MTREEAIKILKSKMDGKTDTSYEWCECVRMAIKALEQESCEDAEIKKIAEWEIKGKNAELWVVKGNLQVRYLGTIHNIPLPSVIPQQKTGRWIESHIPESTLCECSVCGFSCGAYSFNFCPNCGAKMKEMKYMTIDNPCYHCYTGAIGECAMIGCGYLYNPWSQDLESETMEILNPQAESEEV